MVLACEMIAVGTACTSLQQFAPTCIGKPPYLPAAGIDRYIDPVLIAMQFKLPHFTMANCSETEDCHPCLRLIATNEAKMLSHNVVTCELVK